MRVVVFLATLVDTCIDDRKVILSENRVSFNLLEVHFVPERTFSFDY